MITTKNYLQQNFDTSNWPKNLIDGHNFVTGSTLNFKHLEMYDEDSVIKNAIDLHVKQLNEYLATKPSKSTKANTKKVIKQKKVKAPKSKPSNELEVLPIQVTLIKRYIGLHKKSHNRKKIMGLIDAIQKAIFDKRINKNTQYANQIDGMQKKLIKVYNTMLTDKITTIEIELSNYSELKVIADSYGALKSVNLVKRYIAMDGEFNTKEKAQKLYNDIDRFININPKDKYETTLYAIAGELKRFLDGSNSTLTINEVALSGFNFSKYARKALHAGKRATDYVKKGYNKVKPHITNAKAVVKEAAKKSYTKLDEKLAKMQQENLKGVTDLFVKGNQISQEPKGKTIKLQGDIGKFLGELEQNELAITLEGDQGAGKSQLQYQIVNAFADAGLKNGVFTLEMARNTVPNNAFINQYISPTNLPKIEFAEQAPEGIATIRKAAPLFDAIFIDSWGKLKAEKDDFDKLRKDFPNTIFVVIFQRTGAKIIRGGTNPLYDAGINIELFKVDDTFENNYAKTTKNRYGKTGLKYNISKKQLIDENK